MNELSVNTKYVRWIRLIDMIGKPTVKKYRACLEILPKGWNFLFLYMYILVLRKIGLTYNPM